jgi:N-acetyl-anhydromuramyl-L-alanine amidase AmpD
MILESYPMLLDGETEVKNEKELLQMEDGPLMNGGQSVQYLIVHCSATRVTKDYTEEQLLKDHKARGFRTVGYHFYIRKSGVVTPFRKLLEVGAHCRPWNRCSIGICYEGGLDANGKPADTRTPEQAEALAALLIRLHKTFPRAKIRGHRDMPNTVPKSCPCFDVQASLGYIEKL